jgi:hypothetical protein
MPRAIQDAGVEEYDRRSRSIGCLTAIGIMLLIGVPLFFLNAIGECLPRDGGVTMAACDSGKRAIGLFCLFGVPIIAGVVGWAVTKAGYRRSRYASRDPASPE